MLSKPSIYFLLKLWKIKKQVKGLGKNTGAVTIETMYCSSSLKGARNLAVKASSCVYYIYKI